MEEQDLKRRMKQDVKGFRKMIDEELETAEEEKKTASGEAKEEIEKEERIIKKIAKDALDFEKEVEDEDFEE